MHILSSISQYLLNNANNIFILISELHNVLLVVLYLILVALPSVRSAPASDLNSRTRREEHKKWTNPCGGSGNTIAILETNTPGYIRDMELLNLIVQQAKIAYFYARIVHQKFVSITFCLIV